MVRWVGRGAMSCQTCEDGKLRCKGGQQQSRAAEAVPCTKAVGRAQQAPRMGATAQGGSTCLNVLVVHAPHSIRCQVVGKRPRLRGWQGSLGEQR